MKSIRELQLVAELLTLDSQREYSQAEWDHRRVRQKEIARELGKSDDPDIVKIAIRVMADGHTANCRGAIVALIQ